MPSEQVASNKLKQPYYQHVIAVCIAIDQQTSETILYSFIHKACYACIHFYHVFYISA